MVRVQLWSAILRIPFGLGNVVILEYIKVALGLVGVNEIGEVGLVSKRRVWRSGPKRPCGSMARGMRTMLRARRSPMTVSPMVMVPVVGSVLLSRPIFFFSYFCRCESAWAVNIVVTSGEVGSKEGHGGGLEMVTSKPTVV